jgi:hypothetical protein
LSGQENGVGTDLLSAAYLRHHPSGAMRWLKAPR